MLTSQTLYRLNVMPPCNAWNGVGYPLWYFRRVLHIQSVREKKSIFSNLDIQSFSWWKKLIIKLKSRKTANWASESRGIVKSKSGNISNLIVVPLYGNVAIFCLAIVMMSFIRISNAPQQVQKWLSSNVHRISFHLFRRSQISEKNTVSCPKLNCI